MMSALLVLVSAVAGGTMPAPMIVVDLRSASIRVSDAMPGLRGPAAALEIARLPEGRSSVTLSRRAIETLVHRVAPGLALGGADATLVTFRRVARPAVALTCFVARDAIGAGETVGAERVRPQSCAAASMAGTRTSYDTHAGAVVARAPIAAGDTVGRWLPRAAPVVTRGEALTLISRSGPVTVERPVAALQSGRRGGRVFVRSAEGRIFAVRVAERRS